MKKGKAMIYLCEWLVRDKVQTNGWFSTTVLPETMISDARNREKEREKGVEKGIDKCLKLASDVAHPELR